MALLETAAEYIVGMITKNEEVKKFPEEFINESVKWVKSWFLTPEDPKTMEKLNNPNKSIEYKKDIVEDKLDELKDNAQFQKELNEKLQAYTQHKIKRKGVTPTNTVAHAPSSTYRTPPRIVLVRLVTQNRLCDP